MLLACSNGTGSEGAGAENPAFGTGAPVGCACGCPRFDESPAVPVSYTHLDVYKRQAQGHLERLYTFKDFAQSLAFANKVGAVAEAEGHHPDLYVACLLYTSRCV